MTQLEKLCINSFIFSIILSHPTQMNFSLNRYTLEKFMVNYLDLKKVNFTCRKCGNCCYNILRKVEIGQYGYNFQGKFTYNPQTSVSISYTEVPELKKNLYNQYILELDIHPGDVFFMKDFSIGFIFDYQLEVKKKKYCRYYDIRERVCTIHPIRPTACRAYPFTVNLNNPTFPTIIL